jgi:3-methyl-2-oxobutanoate hydroxymethyltransferase|tara:strand:+ start:596 stop:1606 length:1011 start_codon:yes stop_codon:yes gene_type:complete
MKEIRKTNVDPSPPDGKNFHSSTPANTVPHAYPHERRGDTPPDQRKKTTILTLNNQKKKGIKTVGVTAYDYPQALLADKAGVDWILVGDSIGMTTLGYKTTIPVTMDDMLPHCTAVWRANQSSFLIGDMPFMSYQISDELAIENAGKFIQKGMDAVKVEGAMYDRISAIANAGIVVMSHLGLTPHTRTKLGGYRVQGKTKESADVILEQALKLQDAGVSFLLLEAMPREAGKYVAEQLDIPIYGIGAGDKVDGQLVIQHDLIGMFFEFKSKFVKRYCEAGQLIEDSLKQYAQEVREGVFPGPDQFYEIKEEELEKLMADERWKYETDPSKTRSHSF